MKTAWYEKQGPARQVLTVGQMSDPAPGPEELRIRIATSGINPGDIRKRQDDFGYGMAYPRVIPHGDGAGQMDQIGDGIPSEWLGKSVWCYGAQTYRRFGTAAELTVVTAARTVPLPANVPMEQAACHSSARRTRSRACQRMHGTGARNCRIRGIVYGPAGASRRSSCYWYHPDAGGGTNGKTSRSARAPGHQWGTSSASKSPRSRGNRRYR